MSSAVFVAPIFSATDWRNIIGYVQPAWSNVECHGMARSLKNQLKGDVDHVGTGIANKWKNYFFEMKGDEGMA